jgi:hypothetical protein
MNWYYDSGGGQRQGPISEAELDRLIAAGTITADTLVWHEGMASWAALREARPTATPGVAPLTLETERCDSCGKFFPPSELIQIQDRRICGTCKPAVIRQLQQGAELPSALALDRRGPPWEERAQLGTVKAAWETIKAVLVKPAETFERMKREGGLGGPLTYNLLLGTIGGIASLIYNFGIQFAGFSAQQHSASQQVLATAGFGTGAIFIFAVLMPVFIALGAFIYSGILHLSLMVCGGAKQPFETTFRVYNYSSGSAAALQVIPICGAAVSGIWALVCMCIGMAKAHEITTGRAVLAVLLPTIVCCVAVFGILGAILGIAMGAQSMHPSP